MSCCGVSYEDVADLFHFKRFAQVVVHASSEAAFAFPGEGIGGEGNDGQVGKWRLCPNPPGGFMAIHPRHTHIHEHQIETLLVKLLDSFRTTGGYTDGYTEGLQ